MAVKGRWWFLRTDKDLLLRANGMKFAAGCHGTGSPSKEEVRLMAAERFRDKILLRRAVVCVNRGIQELARTYYRARYRGNV
jgi:hypothetical protein